MATIKRNGDRVLLKNGKVSCSCCDTECCMYPSVPYFNDEYTIDDLPDEVVMNFFGDTTTVSKTENKFTPYEGTFGDNNQASISIDEDEAGSWIVVWGGNSFEAGDCLIKGDGNLTPGNDTIEDQFADTYTVSGSISGTVTRESVCVWRGTGLTLTNFGYQWKVNGNNKSGFQNTPVGSYAGGFTVS